MRFYKIIFLIFVICSLSYSKGGVSISRGSSSRSSSIGNRGPSRSTSHSLSSSARPSKVNSITGRTNARGQYTHIEHIEIHEIHYYKHPYYNNGNNWLLYYLLLNNHTKKYDTVYANSKEELESKVKQATTEYEESDNTFTILISIIIVIILVVAFLFIFQKIKL